MARNKDQHLVSQFTIRQFLGERDRLFCLDKRTLSVVDRVHGNRPADILKQSYYYTTDTDDFDGDVVRPLEDKLAPLCRALTADLEIAVGEDDAWHDLVDWCALALTRSRYVEHVMPTVYETLAPEHKEDLPTDAKTLTLVGRRATFDRIRVEMRKSRVMFRFLRAPRDFAFYLTDYPPIPVPLESYQVGPICPMLLPIAHDWMLIQVPMDVAKDFLKEMDTTLESLTLFQCGWAQRLIYSADLSSLDFAASVLSDAQAGAYGAMGRRAALPFFGFGEVSELQSILAPPAETME